MKKILLFVFFLALFTTHLYSQWTHIFPKYTPNEFSTIFSTISALRFTDSKTGFAANDGLVIRTIDGGESWDSLFIKQELSVFPIIPFFIDKDFGFIATTTGVTKTTDGGISWSKYVFDEVKYIMDMFFVDKSTGYLLTDVELFKTTNEGDTWFKIYDTLGEKLYFLDSETGFILGSWGLEKTTDGGTTWLYKSFVNTTSICFVNYNTGYLTGENVIFKTTDKGDSWKSIYSSSDPLPFVSVFFPDLKTGYAATGSNIYKTSNEGSTWERLLLPEANPQITSLYFVNADTGYTASNTYGSILKTTDGGKNWFDTDGSFYKKEFWSIYAVSDGTTYIAGSQSTILKSEDGFSNWKKLRTGTSDRLFSIHFTDKDTGFAAGELGTIIKTTDSGITWNKLDYKSSSNISAFYFTSTKTIYGISSDSGKLYKSTDGCLSWRKSSLDIGDMALPCFTDENTGYISNVNSIYKTTDAGGSWHQIFYNKDLSTYNGWPGPKTICFVNEQVGFVLFSLGIVKTTDAGKTWSIFNKPAGYAKLLTLFFVNEEVGYAAGSWGTIMKTVDGGESWHFIDGGRSERITFVSIYFRNEDEGIIIGDGGSVMKTSNGGGPFVTDVKFSEGAVPENFELMQNYPNPFNPVTTISYSIPEQALVELKVFDMLGREVITLINKEQNAGKYNVEFDGSSLPSGVYIYNINAGNYKSSRKLVLLK